MDPKTPREECLTACGGRGESLGPARVTCPKHAHVMRAPRPSRRALARRRRFLGSRRLLLARLLAVAPPPAAWCRPLPTRGGRLGGLVPYPFPRGCCSQPVRSPVRVWCLPLTVTHPSRLCWPQAPKCQSTCQSAGGTLPRLVSLIVGSFIRLANNSKQPAFIAPRLCAKSARGQVEYPMLAYM